MIKNFVLGHYVRLRSNVRRGVERGATAVEYGLLVAGIALAIGALVWGLGTAISNRVQQAQNCVNGTVAAPNCGPVGGGGGGGGG